MKCNACGKTRESLTFEQAIKCKNVRVFTPPAISHNWLIGEDYGGQQIDKIIKPLFPVSWRALMEG